MLQVLPQVGESSRFAANAIFDPASSRAAPAVPGDIRTASAANKPAITARAMRDALCALIPPPLSEAEGIAFRSHRQEGVGRLQPQLRPVVLHIVLALVENVLGVLLRLREADVVESQAAPAPLVHVPVAGVVGGHRGDLVPVVALNQVAQVPAAVGDV